MEVLIEATSDYDSENNDCPRFYPCPKDCPCNGGTCECWRDPSY